MATYPYSKDIHSEPEQHNLENVNDRYALDPQIENDLELEGLTLYEKKAVLVNRELDRQGMGRYQWMIFLLCGFGYFLDLLWAQAFGLVVSPMQKEFGFSDSELGNLFSSFSAGLTAGAFFWGVLVDIIGRYWAFNFTVLFSSVFGICLGAPNNYNAVLVLTAFTGIGIGGNIPIDTTITLECLPQNRRWLLPTLSVFQPLGVVICSALALAFIPNHSCDTSLSSCNSVPAGQPCCTKSDNYGWRYLMFTLGGITIAIFVSRFFLFRFQESPKYLLYRGQDEKALSALHYIAKFNKKECQLTLDTFSTLSDDTSSAESTRPVLGSGAMQSKASISHKIRIEFERFKLLFSSLTLIRLVVLVWIIYAFDYWAFNIAGGFLPTILLRKGTQLGLTLVETYRSYVYIYIFGIPGVLAGTLIYKWRRIALFVSSVLFGVCLFIFTVVNSPASYIGINGLVYFFQSMFNAVLYGWTPEAFEAPVRGTACGSSSFIGRLFGIIAPIAATRVLAYSTNGVLYLAGGSVFICSIAILLLPGEYLGTQSY